jgi:ADP-ribose pyrophosphatase YjhB (NUDIX family)
MTPSRPPRHSVSVSAAIVDDDERFLAIRRSDNGNWEPPGGVLEVAESIESGLIREVAEETGLAVKPLALTGVYKNMERAVVALVFRCRVLRQTAHPSTEEVREMAWLTRDELTRMSEAYRVRLLDSLDAPWPHVRAHDGVRLVQRAGSNDAVDATLE